MIPDEGDVRVLVRRLDGARDLPVPTKATANASGFDLRAAVDGRVVVPPGGWFLVPTGVAIALPSGYEAQVRPRSGLALDRGVTMLNSPGTIDADYRGEIGVIVVNHGTTPFEVARGDRIAQLVVQAVPRVVLDEADALPPSPRGGGGFGHTGAR